MVSSYFFSFSWKIRIILRTLPENREPSEISVPFSLWASLQIRWLTVIAPHLSYRELSRVAIFLRRKAQELGTRYSFTVVDNGSALFLQWFCGVLLFAIKPVLQCFAKVQGCWYPSVHLDLPTSKWPIMLLEVCTQSSPQGSNWKYWWNYGS